MLRVVGRVAAMWAVLAMMVAGAGQSAIGALGGIAEAEFAAEPSESSDGGAADVAQLATEGTLRVSGRTCDGQMLGSGFVLDGMTLTNRHLVQGATEFKVDNPSAGSALLTPKLATVHRRATELDLVGAAQVGEQVFISAEQNPEVGDLVYVAGHAGGGETLVVAGRVHLFDIGTPWGYGGEVMLLDVATTGGFSGGPVLDEEGQVVGMLQGFSPTLDLTIAIPIETMSAWAQTGGSAPIADCG